MNTNLFTSQITVNIDNLNKSKLYETNKKQYLDLYNQQLCKFLYNDKFKNKSIEAQTICAETLVEAFELCKDKNALKSIFKYKYLLPYINSSKTKQLAKLLYKIKKPSDFNERPTKFSEKLFSMKPSLDNEYVIVRLLGIKIKFIKNTKQKKAHDLINKEIKNYKFVHIMLNDKFNKPFVDFLNRNFDHKEHMVICYRIPHYNNVVQKFPEGKNVYEYFDIFKLDLNRKNIKKIIFHSLFVPQAIQYLYQNPKLLQEKAYWVIWGGDLYNAKRDEENDFVRKNFRGYLTDFDTEIAKEKYNIYHKPFYCIHAIFPITLEMLNIAKENEFKRNFIKIQINNSCDASTLEMLDILTKFKDENIKITTILSYGKMEFKESIIKKGKELFDEKFEYIDKHLSPQEYANHLAQNDILILNQNRQQGVGNTNASISLGKKVFIKKEVSTFKKLHDFGIKIYDTNEIQNLTFEDFIKNDMQDISKQNALKFFDEKYKTGLWEQIFNAE